MQNLLDASKMELTVSYGQKIKNNSFKILQQTVNETPVLRLETGLTLGRISASFTDVETANAFVAMFPKYCKLSVGIISGSNEFNFCVMFPLGHNVEDDKVAGAFNETAIKRVNKQLEVLETIFN
tara:strand:+ start:463 stop:837 length:375 start_codon:yes stop_codon:yes gene_type:complete